LAKGHTQPAENGYKITKFLMKKNASNEKLEKNNLHNPSFRHRGGGALIMRGLRM
jgi:hypothetical protein